MPKTKPSTRITINRAPVLTLWATVVAERLGFDWMEALTLGRAVAGLNAYAKGKALGIFHPKPADLKAKRKELKHGEQLTVTLLHRAVPVVHTPKGLRAVAKGKPTDPASVQKYVEGKFGDGYGAVKKTMTVLAKAYESSDLADRAYALYEKFRPVVPAGTKGWGASGVLDLDLVRPLRN